MKNHSVGKFVLKTLVGVVGVAGAVAGGTAAALYQRNKKKMLEHEGQNNLMYTVNCGGLSLEAKEDTDNVFLSCACAGVKLDLTKIEMDHDVKVDLLAVCSGIRIIVPAGVKVVCEVAGKSGSLVNKAEECEFEGVPVIHIVGNAISSGIMVAGIDE